MKIFALFLALIINAEISLAAPTPTPTPEPRAVEVDFFGGLTGFDKSAYRVVKTSMASLLADGVIDQFKTTFWGREGGSSFCVELGPDPKITIEQVTQVLDVIHPGNNSVYKYVLVEKCK